MDNLDYAAILENDFLTAIRTVSIFFVAGIALFNFTSSGKNFSIISLLLSIILLIAVDADYFIERNRIRELGFTPRIVIDIIAFAIIAVILLLIWILYSVYMTPQRSLSNIAKEVEEEIEKEIEGTNLQIVKSIKELEERLLITNKNLIESIKNINNPNYVSSDIPNILSRQPSQQSKTYKKSDIGELTMRETAKHHDSIVDTSLLAAVV